MLAVSWQGPGALLAGCGLVGVGWGHRSPGLWAIWGEVGGYFPPTAWKCFVNDTVCCCCGCGWFLQAGSSGGWKSCRWSETSTTVAHVVTHWENPEEMKHYRTVCLYVTIRHSSSELPPQDCAPHSVSILAKYPPNPNRFCQVHELHKCFSLLKQVNISAVGGERQYSAGPSPLWFPAHFSLRGLVILW